MHATTTLQNYQHVSPEIISSKSLGQEVGTLIIRVHTNELDRCSRLHSNYQSLRVQHYLDLELLELGEIIISGIWNHFIEDYMN
jgi:hypothetical protein